MKFVRLLNDEGRTYPSYTDLWNLIDLSGFESVPQDRMGTDQIDPQETYLFYINNGNAAAIASAIRDKHPQTRLILWQLERPRLVEPNELATLTPDCFPEVWFSDRWLAQQCREVRGPATNIKYLPVGGHPKLGQLRNAIPAYDFAVMAYIWGRRDDWIGRLRRQGYRIAPNAWGQERDEILASSRAGLCLHQDSLGIIEPLRYTLFSCWGLPLIAERSMDQFPYLTYSMEQLDEATDGQANYDLMTREYTFRACIEKALAE